VLVQALDAIDTLKKTKDNGIYQRDVYRIVESQEQVATIGLVDDLDEQFLLEQMLDQAKPAYRKNSQHLHYLLATPFRYPPLKHGSRFGSRMTPSFFYASEEVETALAECAYYRFLFLEGMKTPYLRTINSSYTLFSVFIDSVSAVDLTLLDEPFQTMLCSVNDYSFTQALGRKLLDKQVKVLRFNSARTTSVLGGNLGVNVAITQPQEIKSTAPQQCTTWLCSTTAEKVSFSSPKKPVISFDQKQFLVDGLFPSIL
jgi:hypothetical protein